MAARARSALPERELRLTREQSVDRIQGGAMLSLLGIESPGLTSSLAIGEMVRDIVAQSFYNEKATRQPSPNKGARNEEHAHRLDAWA